jgi:hypothetical protein
MSRSAGTCDSFANLEVKALSRDDRATSSYNSPRFCIKRAYFWKVFGGNIDKPDDLLLVTLQSLYFQKFVCLQISERLI